MRNANHYMAQNFEAASAAAPLTNGIAFQYAMEGQRLEYVRRYYAKIDWIPTCMT